MIGVIISGGEIYDYDILKTHIPNNAFIVCADSGYDHIINIGITPNLIIGDMDSIKNYIKEECDRIIGNVEKDETDTQLALDYLIQRGYNDIILFGALGGRVDHLFANVALLEYANSQNVCLKIQDGYTTIMFAKDKSNINIYGDIGDIVSLFAISESVNNITTINLKYPLVNEKLLRYPSRGISNIMTDKICSVRFLSGALIIIHIEKDGVNVT